MDTTQRLARHVARLCVERKGEDVLLIDVRGRSSYTDFLVIASGTSDRHVQSMAEHLTTALRERGIRPLGVEGLREGHWALLDLGSVIVHIFHPFTRQVYNLEALWADAPKIELESRERRVHEGA